MLLNYAYWIVAQVRRLHRQGKAKVAHDMGSVGRAAHVEQGHLLGLNFTVQNNAQHENLQHEVLSLHVECCKHIQKLRDQRVRC